jgi:hypothetical protein
VLVALSVAIGGLLWWDHSRPSTDEAQRAKTRLLPGFDSAAADAIAIERGGAMIRLRREGSGWWLVEPHRKAEQPSVDALLGALEFGMLERRVKADADLREKAGVNRPAVVLTVGKSRLAIGADAPGRGVYVARDGEPELLVAEHRLKELTDVAAEDWISKRLTVDDSDDAHAIAIGGVAIERGASDWRLTAPLHARASEVAVARVRKSLAELRATRFVAEGAGTTPVRLDGHDEAQLGGDCPGHAGERLVARADGAALCFEAKSLAALEVKPDLLRERRPFPLELDAISVVDAELDGKSISLRRSEGVWRITAPLESAAVADDAAIRAWLKAVLAIEATGFGSAIAHPRGRLHLDQIDARLGDTTVQPKGDDGAMVVGDVLLRLFREPLVERFRSHRVLTFKPSELVKIEFEPDFLFTDQSDSAEAALFDLHAASFLPPSTKIVPARTVRITLKSGIHRLVIARDCAARLDDGVPFRLNEEVCATLLRGLDARPTRP